MFVRRGFVRTPVLTQVRGRVNGREIATRGLPVHARHTPKNAI